MYTVPTFLVVYIVCLSLNAASFDCDKASLTLEKTLCGNPHLSSLDSDLGKLYFSIRNMLNAEDRTAFIDKHKVWLAQRTELCKSHDDKCLVKLYKIRNEALNNLNQSYLSQFNFASGSYTYSQDCNLELSIFEENSEYKYAFSVNQKTHEGPVKIPSSLEAITLHNFDAQHPHIEDMIFSFTEKGMVIQNLGGAFNPYVVFHECSEKFIELVKVKDNCEFSKHTPISLQPGLQANVKLEDPDCTKTGLNLSITDAKNEVLMSYDIPSSTLTLHEDSLMPDTIKNKASRMLSTLTDLHKWPKFRFSTAEDGLSLSDAFEKLISRTDIDDAEKWNKVSELEECQFEYRITRELYNQYSAKNLPLFGFGFAENGVYYTYLPDSNKIIEVGGGCFSEVIGSMAR